MEQNQIDIISQSNVQTRGPLLILYGTTFGMSSKFAFSMATEAKHKGFQARVSSVGDIKVEELSQLQIPVVFLLSTYGTGGPSADANIFQQELSIYQDSLSNLNYVIFGLGNSNYEHFCGMSETTEKRLKELQANNLFELRKGDAKTDSTEKSFNEFKSEIWPILVRKYPVFEISVQELIEQSLPFKLEKLQQDATEILPLLAPGENNQIYETQLKDYINTPEFEILDIRPLKSQQGQSTQTYHIVLKNQDGMEYQTGGNIKVYAENSDQDVEGFAKLLGLNLDQKFDVQMKSKNSKKILPTPICVKQFLKKFCDFKGPLTKSTLYSIGECLVDRKKGELFQGLTSFENDEKFQEEIIQKKHSMQSILKENQAIMPLQQLVNISQKIAPRQYTISSCYDKNPGQVELTITILKEGEKYGLFTGYLQSLAQDFKHQTLKLQYVDSPFKYDSDVPLVCVSTGAGIGPFRAFCQEREHKQHKNEFALYFGCRKKSEDYIYQQELEQYSQNGVINDLQVAFSREQGQQKEYVQHLLLKNKEKIADQIFDKKGKLYICGSQNMTNDVLKTLAQIMAEVKGVASYLTMSKISRMKNEGTILTEIQK